MDGLGDGLPGYKKVGLLSICLFSLSATANKNQDPHTSLFFFSLSAALDKIQGSHTCLFFTPKRLPCQRYPSRASPHPHRWTSWEPFSDNAYLRPRNPNNSFFDTRAFSNKEQQAPDMCRIPIGLHPGCTPRGAETHRDLRTEECRDVENGRRCRRTTTGTFTMTGDCPRCRAARQLRQRLEREQRERRRQEQNRGGLHGEAARPA